MKKILLLFMIFAGFISCKEDVVNKPERLIEKDKMIDVMYDLSILDAIKYQSPTSLETYKINPSQYILKKYKVDSSQFAQSNIYYASNYTEYKDMYDSVIKRIDVKKTVMDSLVKRQEKKEAKAKADSIKRVKPVSLKKDSIVLKKASTTKKIVKNTLRIK